MTPNVGKRIVIIGNGGTGKSTLASRLGKEFEIPVFHLDLITWKPGWIRMNFKAFESALKDILKEDSWIVDGWSYNESISMRIDRCDTVIFIDFPLWKCYLMVLRRQIKYAFRQNPFYPENSPVLPMTIYILKAVTRLHYRYLPPFRQLLNKYSDKQVLHFKYFRQIDNFLMTVQNIKKAK